ncbi:MarR family winged helix-turn-helix transcriptional regulator [Pannonibacter sp. SL95]|jgi:DNA-binding MarR family transcriptional regulator|uniref:MarR family winged helix-turn-helix transcriptional regulator n=1 Tax=Pannonibacter sp. SL95 TaxID=2995153 RepID=UPI0022730FEE|nr:MarR family winged helix-turn-helix transcriptional regulator [Pannonibacter sp. SL95]MCY1708754.1 MarR family winged helix-turn-helix transcriptional regulator [Pannonibacter sp. SL95]
MSSSKQPSAPSSDAARPAEADPLRLETFLPYRLSILAEVVSRALSRIYADRFGIAIPEWRVVATIGQFGKVTARDVGAHSHMHKTKVSRAVAVLEGLGYVARTPNPVDMRESFLELTPKGAAMYRELVPQARAFSDALLATLPGDSRAELEDLLTRLQDAASQLGGSGEA